MTRSSLAKRLNCLFIACLIVSLGACTGTREERLPTLLAVSLIQDEAPQVALIETVLASDGDYSLLEDSRRTLAAPAIDFDVTNRNSERGELVVLSRADDNEAFIDFFAIRGVNPAEPSAFQPVANKPRLAVSTFEDAEGGFCATSIQVSSSGRYAALFNSTECAGVDDNTIDILDLREERVLERITGGTFGLVDAAPYIDQQTDTLYYLVQDVSDANLIQLNLSNLSRETFATIPNRDQVDISRLGTNLLVLRPSEIIALPLSDPDNPITLSTSSSSRRLVENLVAASTDILILGSNQLTVHRSLQDEDEGSATINAAFGTLEAAEGFAYFTLEGAITRFDLLRYRGSVLEVSDLLRTFSVPELTEPGPVTHLKGILPEPTTP